MDSSTRSHARRLLEGPLFALLAVAYIACISLLPYPGDFLLKVSPIACLVIAVALVDSNTKRRLIIAALVFSGIGDIALAYGKFEFGLGAFLLAHLFYLSVFGRRLRLTPARLAALLGLACYALILLRYLSPHLGEMAVPVCVYMGVILIMASAAICGRDNSIQVAIGAVLFVTSDSLIAIDRFCGNVAGSGYAIMALYYVAQYLLTHDARRPSSSLASMV